MDGIKARMSKIGDSISSGITSIGNKISSSKK